MLDLPPAIAMSMQFLTCAAGLKVGWALTRDPTESLNHVLLVSRWFWQISYFVFEMLKSVLFNPLLGLDVRHLGAMAALSVAVTGFGHMGLRATAWLIDSGGEDLSLAYQMLSLTNIEPVKPNHICSDALCLGVQGTLLRLNLRTCSRFAVRWASIAKTRGLRHAGQLKLAFGSALAF